MVFGTQEICSESCPILKSHSTSSQVAVVGLGYVGLHIARAFGRVLLTIGFDIDSVRVQELRKGRDRNGEVPPVALKTPLLTFTDNPTDLTEADFVIVAVPTTVDKTKRPDFIQMEFIFNNLSEEKEKQLIVNNKYIWII